MMPKGKDSSLEEAFGKKSYLDDLHNSFDLPTFDKSILRGLFFSLCQHFQIRAQCPLDGVLRYV
jgi:hypothetical protein